MRNIKDLFQEKKNIQQRTTRGIPDEKTIFFLFQKVFSEWYGVKGQENISPVQVKDGKLFLKPKTSLWANEVLLQKNTLIEKINTLLGEGYLQDIVITQRSEESFKN